MPLHDGVKKAQITFYEKKDGSKEEKKIGGPVDVMINPSQLNWSLYVEDCSLSVRGSVGNNIGAQNTFKSEVDVRKTLSMQLMFDLVENYENAVQRGQKSYTAIQSDDSFYDDNVVSGGIGDIHIYNSSFCCYSNIYEAFEKSNKIQFSWGESKIKGEIQNMSVRFTYFSKEGEPLRATVNISILGD